MELLKTIESIKMCDEWINQTLDQCTRIQQMYDLGVYTAETRDKQINSRKLILSNLTRLKSCYEDKLKQYELEMDANEETEV